MRGEVFGLLIERDGRVRWYHRQLWEAAERRYQGDDRAQIERHSIMAWYFSDRIPQKLREKLQITSQPLVLNGSPQDVFEDDAIVNKRRCVEALHHMLLAQELVLKRDESLSESLCRFLTCFSLSSAEEPMVKTEEALAVARSTASATTQMSETELQQELLKLTSPCDLAATVEELCDVHHVCAYVLAGEGINTVRNLSKLNRMLAGPGSRFVAPSDCDKANHFYRWVLNSMTEIMQSPRDNCLGTSLAQPRCSVIRSIAFRLFSTYKRRVDVLDRFYNRDGVLQKIPDSFGALLATITAHTDKGTLREI